MEHKIITREDNSEILKYDFENYFVLSRRGMGHNHPQSICRAHWHEDLEFRVVLSGQATDYINGEAVPLKTGQGILVNSRQLHETDYGGSVYLCTLLHPMLLCASRLIEQEFVAPFLEGPPYILLDDKTAWQKKIMDALLEIHHWRDREGAPLKIQSLIYEIWLSLYEHVFREQKNRSAPPKGERGLTAVKDMVLYIQNHYKEKLSLAEIAKVGMVCKNTCIVLFKKYMRDTPVNYLILYRLEKAAELLRSSGASVTEAAFESGFSSVSYFIETFRRIYRRSPLEYQKSRKETLSAGQWIS